MTDRPFKAEEPIAFFITWTCYGTWLPGDERGWHKWGDGGTRPPNELFKRTAQAQMKEPEFLLSDDDRIVVEATIAKHCDVRGWTLHKVNARSNHVHVVVTAPGYAPETVRDQFKAWCTRKLTPVHQGRERFWTEGASCRSTNHDDDLEAAIQYAGEIQDRKHIDYEHEAQASESEL
ncbi:MAG: transposase [Planctomycetota bacterium]|jgi:REP element-mobilizing transposase RayT